MSTLLYINASPRKDRSKSAQVAQAFIEAHRQAHPDDLVKTVALFETILPPFDGPALQAKYAILHGQEPSADERQAWKAVEAVIEEFTSADRYLLAVPMWNFGIPYALKHYLDILIQPGYTFSFSPEAGYAGLVTGKPIQIVYARGGEYSQPETTALDLQRPYLETIFGFMGFTDIRSIVVEPTLMAGPDVAEQRLQAAREQAAKAAQTL